jgi:hypothetical protein
VADVKKPDKKSAVLPIILDNLSPELEKHIMEREAVREQISQKYHDRSLEFVYLAELDSSDGDDDAHFVIAIVARSWEAAEKIAAKHNATTLACRDGDPYYPMVRE